jgi:hypothetical protein
VNLLFAGEPALNDPHLADPDALDKIPLESSEVFWYRRAIIMQKPKKAQSRIIAVSVRLFREDVEAIKERARERGISFADELRVLVHVSVKHRLESGFGDL